MEFDVQSLPERDVYRILVNTVLPRPIALVTSLDEQRCVNTAPFSFFNVMGSDPPIIALGVEGDAQAPDEIGRAHV